MSKARISRNTCSFAGFLFETHKYKNKTFPRQSNLQVMFKNMSNYSRMGNVQRILKAIMKVASLYITSRYHKVI